MTSKDSVKNPFRIDVRIFKDDFRRFALYDMFVTKKRLRLPAIFAAAFLILAGICFAVRNSHAQADLLGWVLLGIGILLPAAYIASFFLSISSTVKQQHINGWDIAYTVGLNDKGVSADKGAEHVDIKWKDMWRAVKTKTCIFLYVNPARAFLLPSHSTDNDFEAIWELIEKHMPAEKLRTK